MPVLAKGAVSHHSLPWHCCKQCGEIIIDGRMERSTTRTLPETQDSYFGNAWTDSHRFQQLSFAGVLLLIGKRSDDDKPRGSLVAQKPTTEKALVISMSDHHELYGIQMTPHLECFGEAGQPTPPGGTGGEVCKAALNGPARAAFLTPRISHDAHALTQCSLPGTHQLGAMCVRLGH
mmetsp:Transcript_115870/g.338862  ORF Transcript_115870/g.338862 Transcript_115870/m.338862 type:complete len:177 (+) Transcript_115870:44-574(+)